MVLILEVKQVAKNTDFLIIVALFLVELWVLINLRFKVDTSGIITLLLHLIISITRIIRSYVAKLEGLMVVAGILLWISLHYFTFEMQLIQITLASDDFETR